MTIEAVKNYTRLMAPVFSDLESIPVHTFFQTIFTSGQTIIDLDAEAVDIDIQRGNKKTAVYIPRGSDAENIGNDEARALLEKYTSDTKIFPLIEEVGPITSNMIRKRMPGENPFARMSTAMKQAALAMKMHLEHVNRIIRKMEYSAAEALRLGQQTIQGGLVYDFYRRAAHNQTVAVTWATSATADPLGDLETAGTKVFRNGNRRPTDTIMSDGAWQNFIETTQVKDAGNNRRIVHFVADMNMSAPAGYDDWVNAGAIFQGRVKAGNWVLNIWTYPAVYDNASGTQIAYLPDPQVLVMAKGSRYDRNFGPADRLEMASLDFYRNTFGIDLEVEVGQQVLNSGIFRSDMFHLDAYSPGNNKVLNIRTQAAPIFVPVEIDTVVKIETA